MSTIVIDLDGTLTLEGSNSAYADHEPNWAVVEKLREYKSKGFRVAIFTARNMRSHAGSIGKINAHTLPIVIDWLKKHDVPYDEIHVGKPWPENGGFYVDDRAIRPDEFTRLSYDEIMTLTGGREREHVN